MILATSTAAGSRRTAVLVRGVAILAGAGGALLAIAPWSPEPAAADITFDSALFSLINQDRLAHGVAPLQWSGALGAVAESAPYAGCGFTIRGRAADMIRREYFSHVIAGCGGRYVFDVLRADGIAYASAGENIGWSSGITDPVAAAQYLNRLFVASPEHLSNILDPAYTAVGTGSWWTQPGQTWSGAGTPLGNVVMAAEEFVAAPARAAAAPPPPARRRSSPASSASPPQSAQRRPLAAASTPQQATGTTHITTAEPATGCGVRPCSGAPRRRDMAFVARRIASPAVPGGSPVTAFTGAAVAGLLVVARRARAPLKRAQPRGVQV